MSGDAGPTPTQPAALAKREREDEGTGLPSDDSPITKRAKIFEQMTSSHHEPPPELLSVLITPDTMSEMQLKEAFKIADGAAKALDPTYEATPAMMEQFLGAVFREWAQDKRVEDIEPLKPFSPGRIIMKGNSSIGDLVMGPNQSKSRHRH